MKLLPCLVQFLNPHLKFCKIWVGVLGSLAVLSCPHSGLALPKFVINSNHWQDSSRIFLANCPESACLGDRIRGVHPKTQWTSKSQLLDLVWVGPARRICQKTDKACLAFRHKTAERQPVMYGLSRTEGVSSLLYQFDAESGEERGSFSLSVPFTTGFLLVEELYFENAWHTFLICVGNTKDLDSRVFIWDISDPARPFNRPVQLESLAHLTENHFRMTAKPCVLRYSDGHFSLVIPGYCQEAAGLYLIHLQYLPKSYFLKVGSSAFLQIQAVDTDTRGYVDKLYLVDERGLLWSLEIQDNQLEPAVKVLTGVDPHRALLKVIKNIQHPSREGYYFGHDPLQGSGLFKLSEEVNSLESQRKMFIMPGHFVDLWIRLGSLILIENLSSKLPLILSLGHPVSKRADRISWKKHLSAKENRPIVQTALLWDPRQQLDTLITLNEDCQITLLQAAITRYQYGRMSWRRKN